MGSQCMLQTKGLGYNYSRFFEIFTPQKGCGEIRNKLNLFMLRMNCYCSCIHTLHQRLGAQNILHTPISRVCPTYR